MTKKVITKYHDVEIDEIELGELLIYVKTWIAKYGEFSKLTIETEDWSLRTQIEHIRSETNEEYSLRLNNEKTYKESINKKELKELARLKEKYE